VVLYSEYGISEWFVFSLAAAARIFKHVFMITSCTIQLWQMSVTMTKTSLSMRKTGASSIVQ
jgi:hypothetical protein